MNVDIKQHFKIYLVSSAPAASAEMKKGEFAKTPLVQTNTPISTPKLIIMQQQHKDLFAILHIVKFMY